MVVVPPTKDGNQLLNPLLLVSTSKLSYFVSFVHAHINESLTINTFTRRMQYMDDKKKQLKTGFLDPLMIS